MRFAEAIAHIEARLQGFAPRKMRMQNYRRAAILMPFFEKDGEAHLLLTLRTDTVEHHKGQISFPGGAHEPQDVSIEDTALRETYEEVGVPMTDMKVIGRLDDFPTITDFLVTPFVGTIPFPYIRDPNPDEVAEILEVPLSVFLSDSSFEIRYREYDGKRYPIFYYYHEGMTIWGFTAFIMNAFIELVFDYNPAPLTVKGDPRKVEYLRRREEGGQR